ncbi:hypothetical protein DW757_13315 [Clostridium sp. AM29-11AC]|uniref:hypothetical protein n=1 Tax=Clostridium sp. AM29-11AC TaxID=2293028 RepID=UPI000E557D90|nr:hypothetical protein [Clostridium sp. AM29-11AC]RHT55674.1 hypothetical protein DW757_13315 [Clostridium sp. AM29-11AC]
MLIELIRAATVTDIVVSERMKVYEASFRYEIKNAPEYSYFLNILNFISQRDKIGITLQDETERVYDFSTGGERDYKEFIKNTLEDEIIDAKIRIDKKVINNHFSIYAFDEFTKDVLSLPVEEVMVAFSNLLKQSSNYLVFDVYSPITTFATKTMFFVPDGNGTVNSEFNRVKRMEECREVSYFYNFDIYEVLPDDFKITINYENNPLTEVFQKIMVLLSISFIATSSTINGSQLKGIINGQRTMEYCCDINALPDNNILYSIYNWIYTGGNPIDKAIIVRNVISLHCKYIPITEVDEKVMASIQSNYNLYLKENVKAYLELKNRVAEFISDTVSKTGEYATGLLDKFKSNIIAIFGFLFTVILANIVSNQPLDNLFTKEITILVECVLLGSFVYLIVCYFQSRYETKKVWDSYEQLKFNYKDILTDEDLLEAFDNDKMIEKMKKSIHKSEIIYLSMWIIFLIGSIIVVEYLSLCPTYSKILNALQRISELILNFSIEH